MMATTSITIPTVIIPTHAPCSFSINPINPPKKISCHQRNLNQAFFSLTRIVLSDQTCLDYAYSSVLELCSSKNSLSQVRQIHAHVLKSKYVHDVAFLNTKLVFAYGKSGSLLDARKVFDEVSDRSVFTWNAMVGACLANGEPCIALDVFEDMHVLGVSPDASTFTSILKACGETEDNCYGVQVHGLATKLGFVTNVFVINSLMGMYTKCNHSRSALRLFEGMGTKADVVSWNSIISAYLVDRQLVEALTLFREMQRSGVVPTTYTFVSALQACEESSLLLFGKEIHAFVLKSNHYLDIYVANALVAMYAKNNKMGEAARIFYAMGEKDSISWNSLLSGFVQNGLYGDAVGTFREMQVAGQKPDRYSVISMITTAGHLGNLLIGCEIHAYAMKNGMVSDLQVANTLIDMYAKCSKMNYADSIFQGIPCKDGFSWTAIVAGYAQNRCHSRAITLFREAQSKGIESGSMLVGSILQICSGLTSNSLVKEVHGCIMRKGSSDLVLQNTLINAYGKCGCTGYASHVFESIKGKNVVSWTSMICCLVQNGLAAEALDIFISMKETGIAPDSVALLSTLSAVTDLSALRKGKEIHGYLMRKEFILDGPIASSLVDMYASCGAIEISRKIFDCIQDKGLVLWTSMISAYGMHGLGKEAVSLFKRMVLENVHPDHICFLALLYACSHSSLVDEGKAFFNSMKYEYGLSPWQEHYACIVDLLGRSNNLEEAFQFVKDMQMEPNAAIWRSLLASCGVHSNIKLGKFAAEKVLEIDSEYPGNYVLVSNFYSLSGRLEDLEKVRMRMRQKGLKKDPGCSWTEVGNKLHVFTARDRSHPESDEIYKKLAQITCTLEREGGYEAETKDILLRVEDREKVKVLNGHSERLAIAYGLLRTSEGTPIRITKNLRVCDDCHVFSKLVSKYFEREIIVRDANRFHHFRCGECSCGDFW